MRPLSCIFLVLAVTGCMRTTLEPTPDLAQMRAAATLGTRPISLGIRPAEFGTVGYQYLLMVLPFGALEVPELNRDLLLWQEIELRLAGYDVRVSEPFAGPWLVLTVEDIDLSAYDLLVTRRVVASIAVRVELFDTSGALIDASTIRRKKTKWRGMPFRSELQFQLEQLLREIAQGVVTEIGMHLGRVKR